MPFVARCPYCRQRVRVPDRALAESLRCPGCQSWYTAVPDSDPVPEARVPAEARSPVAAAAPQPVAAPAPFELSTPLVPSPEPDSECAEPRAARRRPSGGGVLSCLLAAAALLAAASLSTAVASRGLAGVAVGFLVLALGGRSAFAAAGAVVSVLVLATTWAAPALLGPNFEASRRHTEFDPDAVQTVPLKPGSHGALERDGDADASVAALQQGAVRVQIIGAAIGPVQVVDSVKRSTRQHHLAVTVRMRHLGHGPELRFVHWGSVGERTVPAADAWCNGFVLPPARLAPDVALGTAYSQEVAPGAAVDDLLLFTPPPVPGPVRLALPAEAWGGHGTFRFLIPESMIVPAAGAKSRP